MKKLLLLTTIFIFIQVQIGLAQKLGDQPVVVSYIGLPDFPLDKEFTTYSTTLKGSQSHFSYLNIAPNTLLDGYLKLSAMQRVKKGGHFNVEVALGSLEVKRAETKSRDKSKKDKEGNVTKWKEYYKEQKAYMPINVVVKDLNGNVLMEDIVSNEHTLTYDEKHKKSSDLGKAWEKDGRSFTSSKLNGIFKTKLSELSGKLVALYDYEPRKYKYQLLIVKKHDEETGFSKQVELVTSAFKELKASDSIDGVKEKVAPAFEYWKSVQKKYDINDKKERKIYHAATINLARTAYWLDMLDATKGYCNEALKCDFKQNRAEKLLKSIERLEADFQKNDVTSRHYTPDLTGVVAPDSGFVGGYNASTGTAESPVDGTEFEGYIVDGRGDKHTGIFTIRGGSAERPLFGDRLSLGAVFDYKTEHGPQKSYLHPDEVESFGFNGREYIVNKTKSIGGGNLTRNNALYVSAYKADKVEVFEYIPYYKKGRDVDDLQHTMLKLSSNEKYYILGDATYLLKFKKKLAKIYDSCPAVSEMCLGGQFRNNLKDQVNAAKAYAEKCK